jgi:hypothetical protein
MSPHVVGLVMEWWRASGPRSLDRLDTLSQHFAAQYGLDRAEVYRAACAKVQAWERAEMPALPSQKGQWAMTRAEQIDAILAAARQPCLPIVVSSDGKGFSFLHANGTRVGTIRATREDKATEWKGAETTKAARFRMELETMDAPALARQVAYWIEGGKDAGRVADQAERASRPRPRRR